MPRKAPSTAFKKNDPTTGEKDPRINRNGRPKTIAAIREVAQAIANEEVDEGGEPITRVEAILRRWAKSKIFPLEREFLAYAFGRPVTNIDATIAEDPDYLFWKRQREETAAMDPELLRKQLKALAEFELILDELKDEDESQ